MNKKTYNKELEDIKFVVFPEGSFALEVAKRSILPHNFSGTGIAADIKQFDAAVRTEKGMLKAVTLVLLERTLPSSLLQREYDVFVEVVIVRPSLPTQVVKFRPFPASEKREPRWYIEQALSTIITKGDTA